MTTLKVTLASNRMKFNLNTASNIACNHISSPCSRRGWSIVSTKEDPRHVKEHVSVISDDPVQDYDCMDKIQEMICNYLTTTIHYNTQIMREFTDGCAAQYKSRHCIGDLSCSLADFGFPTQRNYFEASHAKGEQDATSELKLLCKRKFSSVQFKCRIFYFVPSSGKDQLSGKDGELFHYC